MIDLKDKTAFITGGASGLGFAMAEAFVRAGMKVVLADIDAAQLARAETELRARQGRVAAALCDVTDRNAVRAAALKAVEAFGKVHVVVNNAGVAVGGQTGTIAERDWDWIVDVNLKGVVYGVETFVPLIRSHGEGGHIVNVASMAGMISPPGMEPYTATKYAVVAMSEGWAAQLAADNIGVSVLCPGFVKTRIHESARNKPQRYGASEPSSGLGADREQAAQMVLSGIEPAVIGARVVEAIQANELYVFTHPEMKAFVEARFGMILAAFDRAAQSPAVAASGAHAPVTLMPKPA